MRRLGAALAAAVLITSLAACSDDDGDSDSPDREDPAGMLHASDMPFEDPQEGTLKKPDPLTQLATGCIGIEQDVLYDAGWTVAARKYFDDDQWSVTTAVFTPPADATGDALQQVRTKAEQCIADEPEATVTPISMGPDDRYAYEVQDGQGGFDSARAYVALDNGALAQVSIQEMPDDEQVGTVLTGLVDDAKS